MNPIGEETLILSYEGIQPGQTIEVGMAPQHAFRPERLKVVAPSDFQIVQILMDGAELIPQNCEIPAWAFQENESIDFPGICPPNAHFVFRVKNETDKAGSFKATLNGKVLLDDFPEVAHSLFRELLDARSQIEDLERALKKMRRQARIPVNARRWTTGIGTVDGEEGEVIDVVVNLRNHGTFKVTGISFSGPCVLKGISIDGAEQEFSIDNHETTSRSQSLDVSGLCPAVNQIAVRVQFAKAGRFSGAAFGWAWGEHSEIP